MFTARLRLFNARLTGIKCKGSRIEVTVPLGAGMGSPFGNGWRSLGWAVCLELGLCSRPCLLSFSFLWAPQVALCFSPVGSKLRVRSRRFPAIVSCTAIDWFQEWPREALESVSLRFLHETEAVEVSISPGPQPEVPALCLALSSSAGCKCWHGCVVLVAARCGHIPLFSAGGTL